MERPTSAVSASTGQASSPADHPHPIAFALQIGRNLVVQRTGLAMVSLVGLNVLPWQAVLAWTATVVAAIAFEGRLLRMAARDGPLSRTARLWAPAMRMFNTTLFAAAAFALIARGGPGERFFAFAVMSASMMHVLMRYYRSPQVLLGSLSPYLVVMTVVGFSLARTALTQGHWLSVLTPVFTIAMFGVQFWSARAQLSGAWLELLAAREAAEHRERAAEEANHAKSQFLATMSHELRTPLNGVLGMAQALMADSLTPVQRERVKVIRRSSESLLGVLNDLLDLSKIEAGALELEIDEFDLEHLVRGVVTAYRPQAEKKGLSFTFEVAPGACGRYWSDAGRIRRILYSLCENAVKFTEAGGVALGVGRAGGKLVFRVSDTGIGIGEDDLAHLFERFFQADATHARRRGGAGVGLTVCRQLTTLMGGKVEVSSKPGQGSVFTVSLPLEPVSAAPETPAAPADTAEVEQPAELRVLAAEDNATNQLVLKAFLAPAGIDPTLVVNGREAVAAWESGAWDIVLMDIQMPEMDGIEAARAIRRREVETGRVRTPIVAVTANAMTHQLAEYAAAGMDGVVAKPVDMTTLFKVMEEALAQAEAQAA